MVATVGQPRQPSRVELQVPPSMASLVLAQVRGSTLALLLLLCKSGCDCCRIFIAQAGPGGDGVGGVGGSGYSGKLSDKLTNKVAEEYLSFG